MAAAPGTSGRMACIVDLRARVVVPSDTLSGDPDEACAVARIVAAHARDVVYVHLVEEGGLRRRIIRVSPSGRREWLS